MAIFDTLSSANRFLLVNLTSKADGKPLCRIQKKVLDILGGYPPDQRDEAFAEFRDDMERQ
jgi:hypothetical protein